MQVKDVHHNIKIIAFISYLVLSYRFFLHLRLFTILYLFFHFFDNSGLLLAMFFLFFFISYTSRVPAYTFIYIFYIFMHTLHILVFPGSKDGRCVGMTSIPPSCTDCHEMWDLHPPGILSICQGL
jgi:hypothetical protein